MSAVRRRASWPVAFAALGVLGAASCRESVIEERWPSYAVRGVVRTAAGAPVRGASVAVLPRRAGCAEPLDSYNGPAVTDASGRYATAFADPFGSFSGCIEVEVTPAAGSGLARRVVLREGVELGRAGVGARELTVDVVLLPATP